MNTICSNAAARSIFALALAAGAASVAMADGVNTFNALITADNHYSVYSDTGGVFAYHGGNELGAGGNPGTYNWSLPEAYLITGDTMYIAAWSDDSVAQGVLAQIQLNDVDTLHSGDARWEVYATHEARGDGDPHPTAADIQSRVMFASTNNLWETPYVGGGNGISPWGLVPGITADARWMWWNTPGDSDPLQGGSGAGEMLIFRTVVPAPGAIGLASLSGLMGLRRRR